MKGGDKWLAKTKVQNEANKQVKTAGDSTMKNEAKTKTSVESRATCG
ncbi:MAG TPA: hypothetical protein VFS97_03675 [Nitrososphaeraceae archaeon]|nr:hypothetical protein [Nitrososphaeraceae archaeon]